MPNALYGKFKESLYGGAPSINWDTDNIRLVLVSATYALAIDSDQFLSDVPALARVATSGNLTGKSRTGGAVSAANIAVSAVTGDEVVAVVVIKDTGVAATSPLAAYLDEFEGFPFVPSGNDELIDFAAAGGVLWS